MSAFDQWEHWCDHVRATIYAQTIALLCRDHMRDGRGAVTPEDMSRFCEEAGAVVDIWHETLMEQMRRGAETP